jgi:hypothetical protein
MKKTRMLLAAATAIAGLVAFAGPAHAVPPQATPAPPFTLPGTDTAGEDGYCPFAVEIVQAAIKPPVETDLPDGSTLLTFTGFGYATAKNVDTGKTLRFNISGPGSVTIDPPEEEGGPSAFTIDAHGPNLLYTTDKNSFEDVPRLAYTTGHVQVHVLASGITDGYELSGRSTDVCALLAP